MALMRAMVLRSAWRPACDARAETPAPGRGELLIEIAACGVRRTDLHVVDGELPKPKLPIVPGHEIVGRVAAVGEGVRGSRCRRTRRRALAGMDLRVCPYCRTTGRTRATRRFTGYTRDGGYATHTIADERYCFRSRRPGRRRGRAVVSSRTDRLAQLPHGGGMEPRSACTAWRRRPHSCAGRIWQGRRVYAFTRAGDIAAQNFARSLGACWAGSAEEAPPEPLDAAIILPRWARSYPPPCAW
ncbi:MAG: alcohol dehydrogenase catalytic domain-containing protein [Xanthobacteraceae bacterium]